MPMSSELRKSDSSLRSLPTNPLTSVCARNFAKRTAPRFARHGAEYLGKAPTGRLLPLKKAVEALGMPACHHESVKRHAKFRRADACSKSIRADGVSRTQRTQQSDAVLRRLMARLTDLWEGS